MEQAVTFINISYETQNNDLKTTTDEVKQNMR